MSERPRIQPSISRPLSRPQTDAEFASRAAAGDFDTVRPSMVLVGRPARAYVGDATDGTHQLVNHTSCVMALSSQTENFVAGSSIRLGQGGLSPYFDQFGPIGSNPGFPAAPQPWWEFGTAGQGGSFRLSAKATPAFMEIQIDGTASVTTATVSFRFSLWNQDSNGNKTGLISATPVAELSNIGSPKPYNLTMRLENDGGPAPGVYEPVTYGERISFTPEQWVGLYFDRTDAGADRQFTWRQLEVTPKSTHWLT